MAEVSRGREVFGRLLAGTGLVWALWAFVGPLIGLQFGNSILDLPILPGLVIFFVGRSVARGSRRGELKPRGVPPAQQQVPSPESNVAGPDPISDKIGREPPPAAEPIVTSKVILEDLEGPEPGQSMGDAPTRKTSAEMVAEARQRYGRRS